MPPAAEELRVLTTGPPGKFLTEESLIGAGQRAGGAEVDFWAEFYWKKNNLKQNRESWGHCVFLPGLWSHIYLLISCDNINCFPYLHTLDLSFSLHTLHFQFTFCKPEPSTADQEKQICFGSQILEERAFSQDFLVYICNGFQDQT